MKTQSELTDFYYKSLFPHVEKLEERRKKLRKKLLLYGFYYAIFISIFFYFLLIPYFNIDTLFFIFGIFSFIGFIAYTLMIARYKDSFKEKVIKPLILEIDKNLSYEKYEVVNKTLFNESSLFKKPDEYTGNDFVQGVIDGVNIQFSDVYAQEEYSDSNNSKKYKTIFEGLFIVADFHKNFQGKTIILPDTAESTFGNLIGSWLQSKNFSQDELVKMDNSAFEKEFVVYSSDQVEARYILSPTLMEQLLTFKENSQHPLYISFNKGNIYLAIEYNKDLFEATVFRSLLSFSLVMEYISTLYLVLGIVQELKLNLKIWSKQ